MATMFDPAASVPAGDVPKNDAAPVPVHLLGPGHCGTVREIRAGDEETFRLKAMGICRGRRVMLLRCGDPLILRVLGTRIGLSARLAGKVYVDACEDDRPEAPVA